MITIEEIVDKKSWEQFLNDHSEVNFLTSWNWGQFHKSLGKKVFYRGYLKNDTLIGVSLLVKEVAKRGNYLTSAGGPILDWSDEELIATWKSDILKIAKKELCLFIRVRPQILNSEKNQNIFGTYGFKESPMHLTADLTLQLDLDNSEENLLSEMRKNTRYEVRKAEKEAIRVEMTTNSEEIDKFYEHQVVLAQKHGFVPFSLDFLKKQFEVFSKDKQVVLFHSYKDDNLLASAFIIFYGQEAVYHYGISTDLNQKLPGSYACQWAAIKEAKKRGLKRYNFWGIAPLEAPKDHRFAGVSLFKRGFGGEEVSYLPARDLPVSPLYSLVYLFEKLRAKRRNLD